METWQDFRQAALSPGQEQLGTGRISSRSTQTLFFLRFEAWFIYQMDSNGICSTWDEFERDLCIYTYIYIYRHMIKWHICSTWDKFWNGLVEVYVYIYIQYIYIYNWLHDLTVLISRLGWVEGSFKFMSHKNTTFAVVNKKTSNSPI